MSVHYPIASGEVTVQIPNVDAKKVASSPHPDQSDLSEPLLTAPKPHPVVQMGGQRSFDCWESSWGGDRVGYSQGNGGSWDMAHVLNRKKGAVRMGSFAPPRPPPQSASILDGMRDQLQLTDQGR